MKWRALCVLLMAAVAGGATRAGAHHGPTVQFETTRSITLTGTVVSLEWQFPHAGFVIAVPDVQGDVVTWEVVLEGLRNPVRRGWKKTTLRVGEQVTVKGSPARDGSAIVNATSVTRPDGQSVVPRS